MVSRTVRPVTKAVSTISSRGQLTIPKEIRDTYGLREGDKVEFRREDGKLVLAPVRSGDNPFLQFVGIGEPVPGGSVRWVRELRGWNPDDPDEIV